MSGEPDEIEALRAEYGAGIAQRKLSLLRELEPRVLPSARSVLRLHETLCFLRAYPDSPELLGQVERMLEGFDRRRDLRRHRDALADTGIAGTRIYFTFYADTALWLADRWPKKLHIDWPTFRKQGALDDALDYLVLWSETVGLDGEDFTVRKWIERLKGPGQTDAEYVVRRFMALDANELVRQSLVDSLDLPLRLDPGPDTPSRTKARAPGVPQPIAFQEGPLDRKRPDLAAELRRPPRAVRSLSPRQGQEMIDLARAAMVTRARDLDAFRFGDARDVRLADCGDGLAFAVIGMRPERRLLLEGVYAFLTLKNGVPIGYVLNSALFGSAEIAFNIFETYRGGEAGRIYGRAIGCVRHLFGADSFVIYPYQLGKQNREALGSGAWWFYQKLGFRPRHPEALALMEQELRSMRKDRRHRSSVATLRKLADHNVYYHLGRQRDDVIGELRLGSVGLKVMDYMAKRFGSDRELGERVCAKEAARRFGVKSMARWGAGERLAWRRWGPVLVLLEGVERWSAKAKREAVQVVRAKGGVRESDFVARFDGHARLRRELCRLARPAT